MTSGGCQVSLNPPSREKARDELSKLVPASYQIKEPLSPTARGRMNSLEGRKRLSWVQPGRQSLKNASAERRLGGAESGGDQHESLQGDLGGFKVNHGPSPGSLCVSGEGRKEAECRGPL